MSVKTLANDEQLVILKAGDKVPDFTMMSSNGAPQRLSEQIGHPVMLIWIDDCNECSETLIDWQYLAESWAVEGLKTWVIWEKEDGDKTPWSRLPVLVYDSNNPYAWWFDSSPAVMLISPDGYLDYVFIDDVKTSRKRVSEQLKVWLKN